MSMTHRGTPCSLFVTKKCNWHTFRNMPCIKLNENEKFTLYNKFWPGGFFL